MQEIPGKPNKTVFGVWYVNSARFFRRDFVLFVNDPTLYSIPIYIQDKEQRKDIVREFKKNLYYGLVADGISEYQVKEKLAEYEPLIYTKTSNRSILGHMNDLMQNMYSYIEREIHRTGDVVSMLSIQPLLNRIPQRTIGWKCAVEAMRESFKSE